MDIYEFEVLYYLAGKTEGITRKQSIKELWKSTDVSEFELRKRFKRAFKALFKMGCIARIEPAIPKECFADEGYGTLQTVRVGEKVFLEILDTHERRYLDNVKYKLTDEGHAQFGKWRKRYEQ